MTKSPEGPEATLDPEARSRRQTDDGIRVFTTDEAEQLSERKLQRALTHTNGKSRMRPLAACMTCGDRRLDGAHG
jgi:hypothetical protein